MNKSDWKLVISLALVIIVSFALLFLVKNNNTPKKALVYYENELVLEIDLSLKGEHEYHVSGYNGDILIKTNDNKIKVEEENSPNHICSKQGYIDSSYEVLVCLPNKVVIKIEDNKEIDTVVK
jgi:hypothetical protein